MTVKLISALTIWYYKVPILCYIKKCIYFSLLELVTLIIGKMLWHDLTGWLYGIYCTFYLINACLITKKIVRNISDKYGAIYSAITQNQLHNDNIKENECKQKYNEISKNSIHYLQIYLKLLAGINIVKLLLFFACIVNMESNITYILRDFAIPVITFLIVVDIMYGYSHDVKILGSILMKTLDKKMKMYTDVYIFIYFILFIISFL